MSILKHQKLLHHRDGDLKFHYFDVGSVFLQKEAVLEKSPSCFLMKQETRVGVKAAV